MIEKFKVDDFMSGLEDKLNEVIDWINEQEPIDKYYDDAMKKYMERELPKNNPYKHTPPKVETKDHFKSKHYSCDYCKGIHEVDTICDHDPARFEKTHKKAYPNHPFYAPTKEEKEKEEFYKCQKELIKFREKEYKENMDAIQARHEWEVGGINDTSYKHTPPKPSFKSGSVPNKEGKKDPSVLEDKNV